MNQTLERIITELEREMDNALDVERRNRAAGSPAQSVAYDSGRYAGIKDALEIVLQHMTPRGLAASIDEALNRGDGSYRP